MIGSEKPDPAVVGADLLARRADLQARLSEIKHEINLPLDQDLEDQAAEVESDEVLAAVGREIESELAVVNQALARLEEGGYGICVDCGQPIASQRLAASPYSVRCFDCASLH